MRPFTFALGTLLSCLGITTATATAATAHSYHIVRSYRLGGSGGWDYLTMDPVSQRLFIGRQDRVMVVNPSNGSIVGMIPGFDRAHGVALDDADGKGFATSGGDASVITFDLKTLKVLGRTHVDNDDDAIVFDPATRRVFTFNGDAHTASVLSASSGHRIGTIQLGAKPEFGVTDGHGRLYVNLESSDQIAEIDGVGMTVSRKWSTGPCHSPAALAIDRIHHLLFSGCRNQTMVISDIRQGKVIAEVPVGRGVDAARYDPATSLAFASARDGTMTVIREESPTSFGVVQTVATKFGARTMALDEQTHEIYTVSADFVPDATNQGDKHRHLPLVPGSFTLLVLRP